MKRLFYGTIIILLGFLACPVLAQEENSSLNLVTSPLPINLVTTPGSTVSAQLKIKNNGIKPENLQVDLMKFSAFGEEGLPRILSREKGDDYFDWVQFSETSFEVAPNEWKTITMTISVPESAAFGYYYAVAFSRKDTQTTSGPRATKIAGATATLVLLEVRVPQALRDIDVLQFATTSKSIYEFLPVKFSVKLKNKGNVHVAPWGNVFIDSYNKKDAAILTINENKGNVLPGTNRIFETEWIDGFPLYTDKTDENGKRVLDNKGSLIKTLKWDFSQANKLRWGKYTARMLLIYDDGKRDVPIESQLTFWVMPWRLIGAGLLITGLMLLGLWSTIIKPIFRMLWRKKDR